MVKTKSKIKKIILSVIALILCIVFILLSLFISALVAGKKNISQNVELQDKHLEYLQNEYYKNYTPCDEQALSSFDIEKAVAQMCKLYLISVPGIDDVATLEPFKIDRTKTQMIIVPVN